MQRQTRGRVVSSFVIPFADSDSPRFRAIVALKYSKSFGSWAPIRPLSGAGAQCAGSQRAEDVPELARVLRRERPPSRAQPHRELGEAERALAALPIAGD